MASQKVSPVKIAGINVLVLIGLLLTTNLLSFLILEIREHSKYLIQSIADGLPSISLAEYKNEFHNLSRWELPNYSDEFRAKQIFDDLKILKTEYRPYIGWSRLQAKLDTITINTEGDRIHTLPHHLPVDAPIVRFFGGSTVFGTGARDNDTTPAIFNRLNPYLRVLNHGEASFLSRQELARLINLYGQGKSADLVVFYDGLNDVGVLCREDTQITGHNRSEEISVRIKQSNSFLHALNGVFLKYTAQLVRYIKVRILGAPQQKYSCASDPTRAQNVARVLINNWKMARSLVIEQGGRFIAILQPVAYYGHPRTEHVFQHLEISALREDYETVYPIIIEMMEDYDYMHDLTSAFNGDSFIYIDYGHVSKLGNQIIAQKIDEIYHAARSAETRPQ